MPKVFKEISVRGETYYSVPSIASRLKLHRATLSRWAAQGVTPTGDGLRVVRDKTNGHLYIAEVSAEMLSRNYKPEVRFELVAAGSLSNGHKSAKPNGAYKIANGSGK